MQTEVLIIIGLLMVFAFLAGTRMAGWSASTRRRRFWSPYKPTRFGIDGKPDLTDVGQQLNAVMAASFRKQKLLSYPEYRIFKLIEDEVVRHGGGYRLFAQTNLGEILRSPDDNAYRSINSKRVDILLVDGGGWPILVVEYQGEGHYQGSAAARDAVKKEALRKACVRYMEISATDRNELILARVREQLGWQAVAAEGIESPAPGGEQAAIAR